MTPQDRAKVRATFLNKIFYADNLSPTEKIVIHQLISYDYKAKNQWCSPSQELLALDSRAGIRTVRRATRAASDLRWISVQRNRVGKNVYSIDYEMIDEYNKEAEAWRANRRGQECQV